MGTHLVPVAGGRLTVEVAVGSTAPVLAVHGVSSQRRLWNWLHAEAPDLTVVAPDLRGRADSEDVGGPFGVRQHANDLVAVLDHLGLGRVHVCGMSMGAFIAVDLAVLHPERVASLILVDGGFPMAAPPGLTRDLLPAIFADRLGRLEHRWASVDDYAEFFCRETAPLLDPADPLLTDYLAHDLAGGRVRLSGQALLDDAADIFFTPPAWGEVTVPTRLAYAEWSTGVDSAPAYSHHAVEGFQQRLTALRSVRFFPGMDHAATIMSKAGASATAELIDEAME